MILQKKLLVRVNHLERICSYNFPVSGISCSHANSFITLRASRSRSESPTKSVTSNNPMPRVMSRALKEMFPQGCPVRRPRGHTIKLPGLSATSRSRRMTITGAETPKHPLVQWRHLVSGGRLGTKFRRADGNRIDKVFSYVDIIASI